MNTPAGRGGCIVGFDVNGDYQGTVPTSNAEFQAFDTANLSLDGANSAMEYILQKSREEPQITTAALVTATENHINTTYPALTHPNENAAGLATARAMTKNAERKSLNRHSSKNLKIKYSKKGSKL